MGAFSMPQLSHDFSVSIDYNGFNYYDNQLLAVNKLHEIKVNVVLIKLFKIQSTDQWKTGICRGRSSC